MVGVSIAVPNKQSKLEGAYLLMGSATFTQGVYRAFTCSPDNPKVRHTITTGLKHAHVYHHRTPPEVLLWLKELFNRFHRGAGHTFLEFLRDVVRAHAEWRSHCMTANIVVRTPNHKMSLSVPGFMRTCVACGPWVSVSDSSLGQRQESRVLYRPAHSPGRDNGRRGEVQETHAPG